MPDELWQQFQTGDRRALSRLLTQIGRGETPTEVRGALLREERRARVVAITGSAGVGKSTLIGRLVEWLRQRGKSVAVLACDPESPLTGGALLGDRVRMPTRPDDAGLFIRSVTSTGGNEAVAAHLDLMIAALSVFGFEIILVETAGAGQSDTAIRALADVLVLLVQPEAGDEMQWQKAGLLEVADLIVVHKADLPGADRLETQLRGLVNLPGCREVPILRVSSGRGTGLEELWTAIEAIPERDAGTSRVANALLRLALERLVERFERATQAGEIKPLADRWARGDLHDNQATDEVLKLLAGK